MNTVSFAFLLLASSFVLAGCSKNPEPAAATRPTKHEHIAPHGGTAVVLGNEAYHVELVREESSGRLQAYLLDGEMEKFIRASMASFEIVATVKGAPETLVFKPIANTATGETVGDTALFEAQAEWLKSTREFEGVIKSLTLRGRTFTDVKFNFPKGNESP